MKSLVPELFCQAQIITFFCDSISIRWVHPGAFHLQGAWEGLLALRVSACRCYLSWMGCLWI